MKPKDIQTCRVMIFRQREAILTQFSENIIKFKNDKNRNFI